jgi:hypothetical protein
VNPAQTAGMKNLKKKMKRVILLQMCVTVGVLYLKLHSLDQRVRKRKDRVADCYQVCQSRKEAEVRLISQTSMVFRVSCTGYIFVKKWILS